MRLRIPRQIAGGLLTLGLAFVWLALEAFRLVAFDGQDGFYLMFGLSREGMRSLALWQPLSYGLLHSGWVHVSMNTLLLLAVAPRLEWMLGRRGLGVVLASGLLLGACLHLALSRNILAGGSGVVFAVLLCATTLSPDSRWLVPFPLSAKNLGRGILLTSLLLVLINPDYGIPGLSQFGGAMVEHGWQSLFRISHACHLGGAVAGWLCARWIMRNRVSLQDLQRDRVRREGDASS